MVSPYPVGVNICYCARPAQVVNPKEAALVIVGAVAAFVLTLVPFAALGSEFMPPLREGSLMYMPNTLPSVSLTQQRRLLKVQDSILMTFPQVESVWGKAGRANTATDWAPISMVETTINLKPLSQWRSA